MTDNILQAHVMSDVFEFAKIVDKSTPYYDMQGVRYFTFYEDELEAFANLIRQYERNRLRPFNWTEKMNEAWHKAIPDLHKAFDDLMKARGE